MHEIYYTQIAGNADLTVLGSSFWREWLPACQNWLKIDKTEHTKTV